MTESTSLEENLKKKLESGEITQEEYDDLVKKFGDLNLLSSKVERDHHRKRKKRHKWSFTGSASMEGDEVDGPVRVSGRLNVDGDLKCQVMKVSGAATIDGDLTVVETTTISGALNVYGDAKFGDYVKTSGRMKVEKNLYLTGPLKTSGKVTTGGEIIAGEPIKVSGKIHSQAIRSKSSVKLSGKMQIEKEVVAEELVSSGGTSRIGGNLQANVVEIAKRYRLRSVEGESNEWGDPDDIDSLPDLGRFISKMVTKFIPMTFNMGGMSKPGMFEIGNNIEGSEIDISYTHVKGDVIGVNIKIGPSVIVDGIVKYKETIELPEGSEINTEKIEG